MTERLYSKEDLAVFFAAGGRFALDDIERLTHEEIIDASKAFAAWQHEQNSALAVLIARALNEGPESVLADFDGGELLRKRVVSDYNAAMHERRPGADQEAGRS